MTRSLRASSGVVGDLVYRSRLAGREIALSERQGCPRGNNRQWVAPSSGRRFMTEREDNENDSVTITDTVRRGM
jgi:hypothetical protein